MDASVDWQAKALQLQNDLDEFRESSLEYEKELEFEIQQLRRRLEATDDDRRQKTDLQQRLQDALTTVGQLQQTMEDQKIQLVKAKSEKALLEMELDKAQAEARVLDSSLADVQLKNDDLVEQLAFLESASEDTRLRMEEMQSRFYEELRELRAQLAEGRTAGETVSDSAEIHCSQQQQQQQQGTQIGAEAQCPGDAIPSPHSAPLPVFGKAVLRELLETTQAIHFHLSSCSDLCADMISR